MIAAFEVVCHGSISPWHLIDQRGQCVCQSGLIRARGDRGSVLASTK
jgi:hypothetical protein